MAQRISRRVLTDYVAHRLNAGDATVIKQLAAYLVDTRRTNELDLIVYDIETALLGKGVVIADVVSARTLAKEAQQAVADYVKTAYGATDVELRQSVDPHLIGGVRIRTPDAEHDTTIRRKLMKLQRIKV